MNREEILDKIKALLANVYPQSKDRILNATENSDLENDLGLNSMGILCMVIAIEEEFGVDFEGTSFSDFTTVGSVVDFIAFGIERK